MFTLKEHNMKPYEEVSKMIRREGICLYTSATGTGKTYVSLKLIEDNDFRTLVIVPKKSIGREWMEAAGKDNNLPYITYAKFSKYKARKIAKVSAIYDLIILDEAHHTGAPVWQKNILTMLAEDRVKVLGLSATPERESDDYNVIDKIFHNYVVVGYDLSQAIGMGILPPFEYIPVMYSKGKQYEELHDKIMSSKADEETVKRLTGKLDYISNQDRIKEILHNHIKNMKRKILVFIPEIADLPDTEELIDFCFNGEASVYSVHSQKSDKECAQQIKSFKKDNSKISILISINMLGEGVHIKGADTIIMLRKTNSRIIISQQLGRVLCPSNVGKKVLVFDFVGNGNKKGKKNLEEVEECEKDISSITEFVRNISDQNIVCEYTKDYIEFIREINMIISQNWTEEEDNILREFYPIEAGNVCKRLPRRTRVACTSRADILGITRYRINPWTEAEINILREFYPIEGREVYKRLPGRTKDACTTKAEKLGVYGPVIYVPWTSEEDNILREFYPIEAGNVCKRLPGRTRSACTTRAVTIGISGEAARPWTEEEDEILRKYYPIEGYDVVKRLPGRTIDSCRGRVVKLKIPSRSFWTLKEIEILRIYYPIEGGEVYKRLPGRTKDACTRRAVSLNIKYDINSSDDHWTEEEINILREFYPIEGREVYKRLPGRTESACRSKACKLGFKRRGSCK